MSTSEVTSSSINVQWEMVPCIHRNGDILGYLVQYTGGVTMSVIGIEATISNLMPSTIYSIQVAALNRNGTGVYSDPRNQLTLGEWQ